MKTLLHPLAVAVSAAALLLLLAGLYIFKEARRQSAAGNVRFTEQYAGVIRQINGDLDSVQKKMKGNVIVVPALVAEVSSEPAAVQPPVTQVVEKDRIIVLQGISWNEDRPLVIIEDRIYKTGDRIGRFTVQKISPQSITLRDADGVLQEIALIREERL